MLTKTLSRFQKLRIALWSCGIIFLAGCGQPNDDAATTQSQTGEKGAKTPQSSEKDDGPQLDAPLEEPDMPKE